jgi:hypothetical protein
MSSARDTVRAKVFSEKSTVTKVTLDEGLVIEVRDGKVGDMIDAVSVEDVKHRMARLLINCCFIPGTEEKVFEEADFDTLMELPFGGTYQKVTDAINSRMDLKTRTEEVGKALRQEPPVS